jgi:hypothetical protein
MQYNSNEIPKAATGTVINQLITIDPNRLHDTV